MKVKAKLGDIGVLTRSQVQERFDRCVKLSTIVATTKCSLDHTANLLDAGARGKAAILKGLEEVHQAALVAKQKLWMPDDRTPYVLEKGSKELISKVQKASKDGKIDDKTAARISKSVRTLIPKVDDLWAKRHHWECKIRDWEEVEKGR
jgi:hypothetical protein